ncbi:hypothetical protein [Sphingobacterium bambusae]|uniref:Uncharacterized protein n=1 Tax=Sphingobacterium bambusae TaxID=662858 RepID=A0ABW6BFM0_9SPHI|nr:hypothetical protein [Sphingobacterium bambusae]WPL47133.1 hypothetical protein SCB77_14290 [Sphingobacterium bambusae]
MNKKYSISQESFLFHKVYDFPPPRTAVKIVNAENLNKKPFINEHHTYTGK